MPNLTPGYGAIADTNRSIPVAQTRVRKYSESVGRSYVASAVARLSSIILLVPKLTSLSYRSMSIARPSGFAAAGIGADSERGDTEPLIG